MAGGETVVEVRQYSGAASAGSIESSDGVDRLQHRWTFGQPSTRSRISPPGARGSVWSVRR